MIRRGALIPSLKTTPSSDSRYCHIQAHLLTCEAFFRMTIIVLDEMTSGHGTRALSVIMSFSLVQICTLDVSIRDEGTKPLRTCKGEGQRVPRANR